VARTRPSFARLTRPSENGGAGTAGATCSTRSLACKMEKHTRSLAIGTPKRTGIRYAETNRHSLHDGLRLMARSPRRPGFDCLRRLKTTEQIRLNLLGTIVVWRRSFFWRDDIAVHLSVLRRSARVVQGGDTKKIIVGLRCCGSLPLTGIGFGWGGCTEAHTAKDIVHV